MTKKQFKKKLKLIIRNPSAYGIRDCILCGREVIGLVGVCFPTEELAKKLNEPQDKTRAVFYGLCDECAKEGRAAADRVEAEITRSIDDGEPIHLLT